MFKASRAALVLPLVMAASMASVVSPAHAATDPARFRAETHLVEQASGCFVARCAPPESRQSFEDLLLYISRIPDGVLRQGDAATNEWIRNNARGSNSHRLSDQRTEADALGCIGSVGAILAGVLVPAAKLLKIKQLIKDLGGAFSAARLLVGAGTAAEKTEAIATALGFLVAELIGIKGVRDNCFS
jgi:hypothetical protein